MRILHILKHCVRGNGHVHVAVDLACEQAARGHEVFFVSGGGTYVPLLTSYNVRHYEFKQDPFGLLLGIYPFFRMMIRERPDIVHAHMMASAGIAFFVTRIIKCPLITTVHNSFDSHSEIMRLGDRVVAVSNSEEKLLIDRGYDPNQLSMVYNGPIDSIRDKLITDNPITITNPFIVTLSGLHRRKRVNDALSAFAKVHKKFPDWRFVVVGSGPDEFKLKSHCQFLSIQDKVIFAGAIFNPKSILQQAQIFMALSEAEPFGLVVAEARASSCAIVVSNVGGMPEVLDSGEAGIIVDLGNVDAAAQALIALMGDKSVLDHWQKAAFIGSGKFSVSAMADGYDKVYASTL